jgi:Na+/H+ antiporter NhaD/arsenite permease-like protein
MISIAVLLLVFVLIAVRQVGRVKLKIWQIMLGGAVIVLLTGQIAPAQALRSINADVMLFLFSVFLIGQAMEESGYLAHLAYRLFGRARSLNGLVLAVLFGAGLLSALLLNDTLAIIGTPVVIALACRAKTQPKILLLALAFAVTIGSVMSPIGNPQNLLIALGGGIASPFVTFLRYLLPPTLLNLVLAYFLLRLFYRKEFYHCPFAPEVEPLKDPPLARVARLSLILLVVLIVARVAVTLVNLPFDFRLTYIALIAALPVLLYTPRRPGMLGRMDWFTLIFFAAMFVLMQSVWDTGVIQSAMSSTKVDLTSTGMILGVSVFLSQLLSNVPLVALYLPVLLHLGAGTPAMMALAAGSTIAGNLTILGAASNVIIIQNAERRGGTTLNFWEFVRIGVPLTAVNMAVYLLFLSI